MKTMKFLMVLPLVLGISSLGDARGDPALPGTFDGITSNDIAAAPLSGEPINADDNASNLIPTGTIVVYQTSESRYGKFLVEQYGQDLQIRWQTFALDGTSIFSAGTGMTITLTWSFDLDAGLLTGFTTDDDFFWESITSVERDLAPHNGATFAVYGTEVPARASSWSGVKALYR